MKPRKFLFIVLRISISIGLLMLLFLLLKDNLGNFYKILSGVNLGLFMLAAVLLLIIVILGALRLKNLLEIQNVCFSNLEMIRISFMALFFNSFMPSSFGGDVIKLYYARGRAKNLIKPFSSLVIDRLIGATALVILASSALLIKGGLITNASAKLIVWFFLLALIVLIMFLFSRFLSEKISVLFFILKLKRLGERVQNLHNILAEFRKSPKLIYALFYGFSIQVLNVFCAYLLSGSLGLNLPLGIFFVFIPVIQIVSALPSLGGLGIREGAFVYFFKDFVQPEYALAISILYLGPMIFLSFFGGFMYMFYGRINRQEVVCD